MSSVSCLLYQEQYMFIFFYLVPFVQGIFFIIFLIQEENTFLYFLFFFSTEPAIWNFSTLLYVVLLHNTVDVCYCLRNFWQPFPTDAYHFKAIASEHPCSDDYVSHEH
jgi:hypothetical protein